MIEAKSEFQFYHRDLPCSCRPRDTPHTGRFSARHADFHWRCDRCGHVKAPGSLARRDEAACLIDRLASFAPRSPRGGTPVNGNEHHLTRAQSSKS